MILMPAACIISAVARLFSSSKRALSSTNTVTFLPFCAAAIKVLMTAEFSATRYWVTMISRVSGLCTAS